MKVIEIKIHFKHETKTKHVSAFDIKLDCLRVNTLYQRIGIKIEANANLYVVGIATY